MGRPVSVLTSARSESRADRVSRLSRQILMDATSAPIAATARATSVTICPREDQLLSATTDVARSTRAPTPKQRTLAHHHAHSSGEAMGGMAGTVIPVGARSKVL